MASQQTQPQAKQPPRWDLANIYSGLDGDDYRQAFARLESELAELAKFFDEHDVRRQEQPPGDAGQIAAVLEQAIQSGNEIVRLVDTLGAFIYGYVSTDSYDAVAAKELSKLEVVDTKRQQLFVRLSGWLGSLEPQLPELMGGSEVLQEHAFFLTHEARQSRYLMSEKLEALAAELCLDGGGAFGKLQGNVTSQLKVPFTRDGREELLPITVVHNLCNDPDPEVRERAYHAEIEGWKSIRTSVAACLNSVKGTAITLARRRGRDSVLSSALDENRIDQPTLDALLGAIRESFPVFRRYLASKAEKLGKQQLPWWDLFAPLGSDKHFGWDDARDFIVEQFGKFTPELGDYARTAFDQNWIDAQPRDGKRGGAFCMSVMGVEESRILANYDGSFDNVSTLAHELGHGFHNHCQQGLPALKRGAPSTLAETASIFCETLIAEAALKEATPAEQLMILESQLAGATQVCLDISSRFLFESRFIEQRQESELSPDEICDLMVAAQAETYGEGVDPKTYHPYMWLWKPHYYAHDANFYNFPYAFGHLFGLGLYARYLEEGDSFIPKYKKLLRATGEDYAAPLAERFGIDIRSPEFWQNSLQIVSGQVDRFEQV